MQYKSYDYGSAVRVFWYDSAAIQGWQYSKNVGQVGRITSLGYVVSSKPECLTLSTSLDTTGASIDPLSIPWGAIVKCESLPDLDLMSKPVSKPRKKDSSG
jgi:hypothetical protein